MKKQSLGLGSIVKTSDSTRTRIQIFVLKFFRKPLTIRCKNVFHWVKTYAIKFPSA